MVLLAITSKWLALELLPAMVHPLVIVSAAAATPAVPAALPLLWGGGRVSLGFAGCALLGESAAA